MSLPLRFGPHLLESVLSCGQSSVLFRASAASHDPAGPLVVKVPMLSLQRSSAFKQLFQERLAAINGVDHGLLVPVVAAGRTHSLVWSASPAIHGWDAEQVLAAMQRSGRRPSPRQVLTLGLRLADGLEALHETTTEAGALVHGELRPSKLIFTPEGDLRLLMVSAATAAAGERSSSSTADRFAWRAPEQLLRQPETVRTDVRGLALLLFVLVTGSNPFQRRTTARTCSAILQDQVLFEGDANLSSSLSGLLRAALSSDPERRPATMRALAASLRNELMRQGGDESWSPWIVGLQITGALNAERESKPNSEQDALLARLGRDAPRAESSHETAPTTPARPPAAPAAPAAPRPTVPVTTAFEQGDADPTVLAPTQPRRTESSGFTLVPDDVEAPAAESPRQLRNPRRGEDRLLPPEPDTTEAVDAPTEELHVPRASGAARIFEAGGAVDSSFVLVTDDPAPTAGLTVGPKGAQDSIPVGLEYPSAREEEDEALLPAMSAEEGMAELAKERAARGEFDDDDDDDESPGDSDTPMEAKIPVDGGTMPDSARVSLVGGAVAQVRAPVMPAPVMPPPVTGPVKVEHAAPLKPAPVMPPPVTGPVKVEHAAPLKPAPVTAPVKTEPPAPVKPVTAPVKAEPPAPVKPVTAPVKTEPPAPVKTEPPAPVKPAPVRPPPAITEPPPAPAKPEPAPKADPPQVASPPPATRPAPPSGRPAWMVPALVALALIVVAVVVLRGGSGGAGGDGAARPDPAPTTQPEKVNPPEPPPPVNPQTEGTAQPEPTPPEPTPPEPTPPGPTTSGDGATKTTGGGTGQTATDPPKPDKVKPPPPPEPVVSAGPPGLVALKADTSTSSNKVYLRGTMRGAFNRPSTALDPGTGPNGGDQYIFTFRGVESQMSLTRIPVASSFVSGVQISSSRDVLELRVLVASGATVNYGNSKDGFNITVIQPRAP